MDLDNIFLYEQTPMAVEAVQAGDAFWGPGGIRRKGDMGKGFLEQAKPACISVSDFKSMFETQEHALATDEQLKELNARVNLSAAGMAEIENIGWLNNTAIQRGNAMTYAGFQKVLLGIDNLTKQFSQLAQYMEDQYISELIKKARTYVGNMRNDAGKLQIDGFNVIDSNISDHLDSIWTLLLQLFEDVKQGKHDPYVAIQLFVNLLPPYAYVVKRYSSLYYYSSGQKLMPGNYPDWVDTISKIVKSRTFHDKLFYYVNLNTMLSFRDKTEICFNIGRELYNPLSGLEFENKYIQNHNKKEYLDIPKRIQEKFEAKDYDHGKGYIGFLI